MCLSEDARTTRMPEGIQEHDEATVKHIVDVGRINKALTTTDD
jgi:hypothetical protein